MDHLSGLDAAFLYMETPETPMHVGGVNIFELPPGYGGDFLEDLRHHIQRRMHLASVFQRKLVNMPFELANPVWVADDDVDMEYHIRSTVLPKPGSREQLDKLVGRLHSSLLDRSRPLWEFYVIDGLQAPPDAPKGTRHVAFYSKVHHAALDGAGGIALANAIMDTGPVPREVRAAPSRRPTGAEHLGIAELTGAGLRHTAGQYLKLARTLPTLARTVVQALRPAADTTGQRVKAPRGNWFGPRTPINVSITNQRVFSSFSLPLDEIKHIAKSNEVTLNDVVLGICSGALRRYLADMGCVPSQPLLAGVPVSLREAGNTDLNNQASMMRVSLASTIADPLERLQAIKRSSTAAKALTGSMKSVIPTDFPSLGAPWLISGMASLFGRSRLANRLPPVTNVAISNVPGPKFALYLAGAKMLTYYPVSIAVHSMALNVTVQSYNGSLDFGLTGCRKALPDLPELARAMQEAHAELLKLTPAVAAVMPASTADAVPEASTRPRPRASAPPTKTANVKAPAKKSPATKAAGPKAKAPLKLVATRAAAPKSTRARRTA
jgi:diacylglycerol O-acyltransferase / wax synthase